MSRPSLLTRVVERLRRDRLNRRLRRACDAAPSTIFLQTASVINHQQPQAIVIGAGCLLGGELVVFPDGGRIRIGDHCFIGGGSRVWSATDVQIGHRVMISHGVNIHDTISHSLHAGRRHQQFLDMSVRCDARLGDIPHRPVVIEDDAWIGLNAVVLKGVRIGRGAVVAAGAIVTKDVAPYTIVAGPVAQVIGESFP